MIFKGPINDNTGKTVVAAGDELTQGNKTDAKLEAMHFLVDGVKGALPS